MNEEKKSCEIDNKKEQSLDELNELDEKKQI